MGLELVSRSHVLQDTLIFREWSSLIPGIWAEVSCTGYQNLWLHFPGLWKLLLTKCRKSLQMPGAKSCSYLTTDKKQTKYK